MVGSDGMRNRRALVIGINQYTSQYALEFAVKDARDVGSVLAMDDYGFDVDYLLDDAATTSAIRQSIERITTPNDGIAIIYYAGHAGPGCAGL